MNLTLNFHKEEKAMEQNAFVQWLIPYLKPICFYVSERIEIFYGIVVALVVILAIMIATRKKKATHY